MIKLQRELAIERLHSGGVITNYYCTSACGHCLYGCSPRWKKEYMDEETLGKALRQIRGLGCNSVHIGGGEPFLDLDGLEMVLGVVRSHGVRIEYVETNSSWLKSKESAIETLSSLKEYGLSTLLISISPFHNEHIPFQKVKGVTEACRVTGVSIFPWISEFYQEIDSFDDRATHTLSEYEERFGRDYVKRIPSRYWVHFGGRALKTFAELFETSDYEQILLRNKGGCEELLDVSHFHIDLFGNYIPGLCSGLAIDCEDLGDTLSPTKYPFLNALWDQGISGFLGIATNTYNFQPSREYMSKCDLCFEIRRYLVLEKKIESRELQPRGIYENV